MSKQTIEVLRVLAEHNLPPIPDGYQLLPLEGIVEKGDRWAYFGAEYWLESVRDGHERPGNNVYIRKIK